MRQTNFLKSFQSSFSLLFVSLLLPILSSLLIIPYIILHEHHLNSLSLSEWTLFYIGVSLAMSLALIHTTSVSLISGYFIGWKAIPFLVISYTIASTIGYFLARRIDKGKMMNSILALKGASEIAEDLKKNEWMVIFLCRLSPVLPFAMMNLLLSLLRADLKKILLAGFVGMLPRTLLFLFVGIQAKSIREALSKETGNSIEQIAVILMLIVSVLGLFYYIIRAFRKKVSKAE